MIKEYEALPVNVSAEVEATCPGAQKKLETLKSKLVAMTEQYAKAVTDVDGKSDEYIDFQARRLCEMAAYIIESYLLVIDAQRSASFIDSAEIFTCKTESWNTERFNYIENSNPGDILNVFKNVSADLSKLDVE